MARPEKNTVSYFPHLVGEGKKMFFIEKKYGNDGYATWFKILETLAVTENHHLNLNNDEEVMYLSARCNITEELLYAIINDLVRIGALSGKLWDVKIVWSQKFIDEIQEAYKRRNNKCITFEDLCKHFESLRIQKHISGELMSQKNYINTQIRLDKIRLEKIREELLPNGNNVVGLTSSPDLPEITDVPEPVKAKEVSFASRCRAFVEKFNEVRGSKFRVTAKVEEKLKARLKDYEPKDIMVALRRAMKDDHHVETNFKYLTPEFILRPDKIEYFLNLPSTSVPATTPQTFINHQDR